VFPHKALFCNFYAYLCAMFIKKIEKGPKGGKVYNYYRLCESIRIGSKTRHNNLLNLGTLDNIHPEELKMLANRVEELYLGYPNDVFSALPPHVEALAVKIHQELREKKKIAVVDIPKKSIKKASKEDVTEEELEELEDCELVNLKTLKHDEVLEMGAEWLCLQAVDELGIAPLLEGTGMSKDAVNKAITLIVSRAVYPASEHKTSQWLESSSALGELIFGGPKKISHHHLYHAGDGLYEQKDILEKHLCTKTNELFDLKDKIVFYDLTNTYFEGRKVGSELAQFGRSKEKRSDCKLVSLALVVNAEGFVKYSKIYEGNIYEAHTLEAIVDGLAADTSQSTKPVVVMDAGISDEANLAMLKAKGHDYLCVTKAKLKEYTSANPDSRPVEITDNRGNKISLQAVKKEDCEDQYLHIRSEQKAVKEAAMDDRASLRFEEELKNLNTSIQRKGGAKKLEKVGERLGRIKERYPTANKHYNVEIQHQNHNATGLTFSTKDTNLPQATHGVYFVRTSLKDAKEKMIWDIYNTLTEIEATFRILKTDLNIRPIFHQKDERTKAHMQLGIIAYMVVNTIRHKLKTAGINHSWTTIIRIMNTQKIVKSSFVNDKGQVVILKKCSEPNSQVLGIYQATKYQTKPFNFKKYVLPQN
jgi:transposase